MKPARLALNAMTRTAGQGSFARAAFIGGMQLPELASFATRRGYLPCARNHEDRSDSPGAGIV